MFLIALDFDGVIVSEQAYFYWEGRKDKKRKVYYEDEAERCCPITISNLNYVCKNVENLIIIISSTWRKYFDLNQLREILEEDGFKYPDLIIDITPSLPRSISDSYSNRGIEIEKWIEDNKEKDITDWVALDDHENNINKDHLILTLQEVGFTLLDAYSLIERFNPNYRRPVFMM
jgi:hypothetical protein